MNILDPEVVPQGPLLIEASAGTGKTFSLQHLFVRKLLAGATVSEILVVTFTKAAVKELKQRIQEVLLAIVQGEYPPYFDPTYLHVVEEAYGQIDQLEVFTIHGFCARALAMYAWEGRLPFSRGEEEGLLVEVKMEVVRHFFRSGLKSLSLGQIHALLKQNFKAHDLEKELALEKGVPFASFEALYQAAQSISFPDRPLSFVELSRSYLKGAEPEEIVAWEKAFDTFRCQKTVENFDALLFLGTKVPALFQFEKRKKRGPAPDEVWAICLEEEFVPLVLYALHPKVLKGRLAHELKPLMKEKLWRLAKLGPDEILEEVAEQKPPFFSALRQKYRVAMIDEFQDTDPLQWSIFEKLFLEDWAGELFLVGDPKQSIYRFREADIYTFLLAQSKMPTAYLDKNYRSHPALVSALNERFNFSPFIPLPKTGQALEYHPVEAAMAGDPSESRVDYVSFDTKEDLYRDLVASIQEKEAKGCAVLVRDRHQAKEVADALDRHSIETYLLKKTSLEGRAEILWLKAWVLAVQSPLDLQKVKALVGTPLIGAKENELSTFAYSELMETLLHLQGEAVAVQFHRFLLKYPSVDRGASLATLWDLVERLDGEKKPLELLDRLYLGFGDKGQDFFDPKAQTGSGVAILTMHMSKGLEFDHVFALGMVAPLPRRERLLKPDGKTPQEVVLDREYDQWMQQEEEAEWIRQIYVTLTRAKETLWIPHYPKQHKNLSHLLFSLSGPAPFRTVVKTPVDQDLRSLPKIKRDKPKVTRAKKQAWVQSYSSRVLQEVTPSFTPNQSAPTRWEGVEKTAHTMPSGKAVGLLWHELLETFPYHQMGSQEKIVEYVGSKALFSGWEEVVSSMMYALFRLPLPGGFCLQEVSPKKFLRESDFLFEEKGEYWQGVVDGFFEHRGLYYLLDWKTHWLGSSGEAYRQEALSSFMQSSSYPLQAAIYKKALEKYLKALGKSEVTFGGFLFMFVRGSVDGHGVWLDVWN